MATQNTNSNADTVHSCKTKLGQQLEALLRTLSVEQINLVRKFALKLKSEREVQS